MKLNTLIFIVIALVVLGGLIWWLSTPNGPGQYDEFAQCLKDRGAKFYGAWWCPHCRDQKAEFGKSVSKLPYIECAPPGQQGVQLQVCKDANIEGYPTWEFGSGASTTRVTRVLTLKELSQQTGCMLPATQ